MPGSFLGEIRYRLAKAHVATLMAFDPVQHLVEAGPFREFSQFTGEVLLQRLTATLGSVLQGGVDFFRDIPDEYIRHAYIMQALTPARNKPKAEVAPGVMVCNTGAMTSGRIIIGRRVGT